MGLRPKSAAASSPQVGGDPNPAVAAATATPQTFVATSYGPPWGGIQGSGVTADGTNLRSSPPIYGVAVDPNVIKLGTNLYIWPNPFEYHGTFKAFDTGGAIKGNRIDFYDWRGRQSQNGWGKRSVKVTRTDHTAGGNTVDIHIPNPIKWIDEAAHALFDFLHIIIEPEKAGKFLANMIAWVLKQIVKAIYNVVILPPWRWSQRATIYYAENYILKDEVSGGRRYAISLKAITTAGFWAIGFAILWGKADDPELGVPPAETMFGRTVRSGHNAIAARRITKPKDVAKKTPVKPKETVSEVPVSIVRRVSASRRRAVKVSGSGTGNNGQQQQDTRAEGVQQQQGTQNDQAQDGTT